MEVVLIIGTGLSIGLLRIFISKKSRKQRKIRVYNISNRIIKNKKYLNTLSERSKPATFK